jgi:hypothetical protein
MTVVGMLVAILPVVGVMMVAVLVVVVDMLIGSIVAAPGQNQDSHVQVSSCSMW